MDEISSGRIKPAQASLRRGRRLKGRAIARGKAAAYLPPVKLMQSGATTPAARSAAGAVARLKMNHAQIKLEDGLPKTPPLRFSPRGGRGVAA